MTKKKLTRLLAVCMACLGMGVFAFSGCKKGGGTTDGSSGGGSEISGGGGSGSEEGGSGSEEGGSGSEEGGSGSEEGGSGSEEGGSGSEEGGSGSEEGGSGSEEGGSGSEEKEPVISGPVKGGVEITKASAGELEAAYVEWTAAENAKWYNVYYSAEGENNWTKLDAPLVRQYKDYYRADMVGLKAGEYDMKVVPVSGEDEEATEFAATASQITVRAQDRSGYAFTGGNVPGAYKADGTLKDGAQVYYITAATAKTITATVYKDDAGKNPTEAVGFQSMLDGRQASSPDNSDSTPLCFRIVGTVSRNDLDHISSSAEGLQIKGARNITIEGVGSDGTVTGFGMLIRNCKNIEIKNLGVINFMDDGISLDTDNSHIWVHNLDIFYGAPGGDKDQAKGDGSLDSKGTDYSTYSYNHFWDSGKSNLLGNGDSESTKSGVTHLTYHHNWYDHSDSRHPRIRTATVHVYNNYFDGNSKYGVGVTKGASAFVESNYYRSTATMKPMMSSLQGTDIAHGTAGQTFSGEAGGMIKAYGNHFEGKYELLTQKNTDVDNIDCYLATERDETVPDTYKTKSGNSTYNNFDTASDFYEYSPDSAEDAKTNVERYAGRVDGGDLKWEFDDEKEDGNYAVIPELKAAVVGYKSGVVKIGGVAVSGGSTSGGSTEGGEGGDTPATIDGVIKFVPSKSGSGFTVVGNVDSNAKATTVDGVNIPAKGALKLESATSITFTLEKEMTITLYLSVGNIKVDGVKKTSDSTADGLSVISLKLGAGEHTLSKADKGSLYLIKLTPVS